MSRPLRALLVLVPLIPLVLGMGACSSDKKDGSQYSSGVDGGLLYGDLTPTQKATICTSQAKYVRARIDTTALTRFWCAFTPAVLTAQDDATCQSAMDTCVNTFKLQLDVTATDPNAPPPQCTQVDASQCNGTVADYESCVDTLADVAISIGTDWACGKRATYGSSPTVGVTACNAVGPTCTAVTGSPTIR
jgi:hypothetical protein